MTSRTMLIQQGTYSEENNRRYIERRALLDTREAMARQLIELIELNEETPREWNDMGDEIQVDSKYEEACYWYERTLSLYNKLKPLYKQNLREPRWMGTSFNKEYDEKNSRYSSPLSINLYDWYVQCDLDYLTHWPHVIEQMKKNLADDMHYKTLPSIDKNKRIKEQWERYESEGQVSGHEVVQAMHDLGLFKQYYDYCKEVMMTKDARAGNISFGTGSSYDYYGSITVQVIELPSSFITPSRMGNINETLNEQRDRKDKEDFAKWEANYDTPEAKAEREAEAQKQRDLDTFMGEGGYTSFARNDDGTTSVWR